jgi:hypothetical protein
VAPVACTAVGEVVAGELRCNQRASLIVKPADEFHNPITTPPLLGPEVSGQRTIFIIWVWVCMSSRQKWCVGGWCGCVLVFMCVRYGECCVSECMYLYG